MPVYTLTARIVSGGQVVAVKQAPFRVRDSAEVEEEILAELRRIEKVLEREADELEAARHDENHPHHHWWC